MDNPQLIATLTHQTQLLQSILSELQHARLGLSDSIPHTRLYCNRSHGGLWYTLDSNNAVVPIPQKSLTGRIIAINFEQVERRNQPAWKLRITVHADITYELESGHDSHFTKSFLAAIASLTPHQLQQPLTLVPQPGQDDSVLFCRVYCDGIPVTAPYNDETDWKTIASQAIANLRAAQ